MKNLSDEILIDTYLKSIKLGLSEGFVELLRKEIEDRKLKLDQDKP